MSIKARAPAIPEFLNIIDAARKKVAAALVKGKAISIERGHYTKNVCKFRCLSCGNEYEMPFELE